MADDGVVAVRQARPGDAEAVAAFTQDTWDEFEHGDYLPDVFPEWIESDGPDQRTLVAEVDGTVVGCCQVVALSEYETWTQGLRVHPDHRGTGVGRALDEACAAWARERGATVLRHMVFSWNEGGLAAARSFGYEPQTAFRWAHRRADAGEGSPPGGDDSTATSDPDAAWASWQRSDARAALAGLALDPDESWALSEWTRERAHRAADERAVIAVQRDGTRAVTWRIRVVDSEAGRRAEYGAAGWTDLAAARALFDAVARDAAAVDADRARVLIPETPRHVADAAAAGADLADHPDLVFEADVTDA